MLAGVELKLLVFNILLFGLLDMLIVNPTLCLILVYTVYRVIETVRYRLGRLNIIRKTMFDERFL